MPYDSGDFCKTATLNCPNNYHLINDTYSTKYNNSSSTSTRLYSEQNDYNEYNSLNDYSNQNYYKYKLNKITKHHHSIYKSSNDKLDPNLNLTNILNNKVINYSNQLPVNQSINSSIKQTNGYHLAKDEQLLQNKLNESNIIKKQTSFNLKQQIKNFKKPEINLSPVDLTKTLDKDMNNNSMTNHLDDSNGSISNKLVNSNCLALERVDCNSKLLYENLTNSPTKNLTNHSANSMDNLMNDLSNSISTNLQNNNSTPNSTTSSNLSSSLNSLNSIPNLNSNIALADITKHLNDNLGILFPSNESTVLTNQYPIVTGTTTLNHHVQLNQQINQIQLNNYSTNSTDSMKSILAFSKTIDNQKLIDPHKTKKNFVKLMNQTKQPLSLLNSIDSKMERIFCEPIKKICRVCGDKASYNNYYVLTCDACKTFFRRSILEQKKLKCHFNGKCQIDVKSRKDCSACRLKKCMLVGMKQELINPTEKCTEEDKKKRNKLTEHNLEQNQLLSNQSDKLNSTFNSPLSSQINSPLNSIASYSNHVVESFSMDNLFNLSTIQTPWINSQNCNQNMVLPLNSNFNSILDSNQLNNHVNNSEVLNFSLPNHSASPLNLSQSSSPLVIQQSQAIFQSQIPASQDSDFLLSNSNSRLNDKNNNSIDDLKYDKSSLSSESSKIDSFQNRILNKKSPTNYSVKRSNENKSPNEESRNEPFSKKSRLIKRSVEDQYQINKPTLIPNKNSSKDKLINLAEKAESLISSDLNLFKNKYNLSNFDGTSFENSEWLYFEKIFRETFESLKKQSTDDDQISRLLLDLSQDHFRKRKLTLDLLIKNDLSESSLRSTLSSSTNDSIDEIDETLKLCSHSLCTYCLKGSCCKEEDEEDEEDEEMIKDREPNEHPDEWIKDEEEKSEDLEELKRAEEDLELEKLNKLNNEFKTKLNKELDLNLELDVIEKSKKKSKNDNDLNNECDTKLDVENLNDGTDEDKDQKTKTEEIDEVENAKFSLSDTNLNKDEEMLELVDDPFDYSKENKVKLIELNDDPFEYANIVDVSKKDPHSRLNRLSSARDESVEQAYEDLCACKCLCKNSRKGYCSFNKILIKLLDGILGFNLNPLIGWSKRELQELHNLHNATQMIVTGDLNEDIKTSFSTETIALQLQSFAVSKFTHAFSYLPKFNSLCKEDQKRLLKPCCAELLLLRSTKHFDSLNEQWAVNSWTKKHEQIKLNFSIMKEKNQIINVRISEIYLKFCEVVKPSWREDDLFMTIIFVIVLFSSAQVIHDKKLSSDLLDEKLSYEEILKRYLELNCNSVNQATIEFNQIQELLKKLTSLKNLFDGIIIDEIED